VIDLLAVTTWAKQIFHNEARNTQDTINDYFVAVSDLFYEWRISVHALCAT
jgi:hypothetical protein